MRHRQGRDLYLVRCSGTGLVKVGSSNDVSHRLKALQTGSATELELIAVLEGGGALERGIHDFYAARRVRGEWFDLTNVGDPVWENIAIMGNAGQLRWWVPCSGGGHTASVTTQQWLNGNVPSMANHHAT